MGGPGGGAGGQGGGTGIGGIGATSGGNTGVAGLTTTGITGANPVASGDPTSQGFGSTPQGGSFGGGNMGISDAAAFGNQIGQAVLAGSMTADEANAVLAGMDTGLAGLAAANTAAIIGGIPTALNAGLSAIGMPVGLGAMIAGSLAAISGQGALGQGTDPIGDQAGPGGLDTIAMQNITGMDTNIDGGTDLTSDPPILKDDLSGLFGGNTGTTFVVPKRTALQDLALSGFTGGA